MTSPGKSASEVASGQNDQQEALQNRGCVLRQAAGSFYGSSDHSISATDYSNGCYILGNNVEKVDSMASHSGYSTEDGSIVQLTIEHSGLASGDACLIYQVYDGLLPIQDGACSVFE